MQPNGVSIGSLANVYKIDNPDVKGVQIYSKNARSTITYAESGQVYVGDVSNAFSKENTNAQVLASGTVVVEDNRREINFRCLQIKSNVPDTVKPLLSIGLLDSDTGFVKFDNGIEDNFLNTAFFPLDVCLKISDIPPLQAFADIADQSSEMYIKAEEDVVCRADRTTAVLKLYTTEACDNTNSQNVEINLGTAFSFQGQFVIARCWRPSENPIFQYINETYKFDNN